MKKTLKPNMKSVMISAFIASETIIIIISIIAAISAGPVIGVLAFLGLSIAANATTYFTYRTREYNFLDNQLEFYEGFINIKKKNIAYNRVTDVSFEQPILQRFLGTGNLKVNTAGGSGYEVKISHIDSPEENYENIKAITEN